MMLGNKLVFSLVLVLLPFSVIAEQRWSDAEKKAMPEYCQAKYSRDPVQYEKWLKIIGPHFIHTHHYCDGLGWLNRYYRAKSEREKKLILQSANGSFMYMVPRVDETWPMRSELYLNLGTVLALQKNDGQALGAMLKAIELDPKMARAYSLTASQYVKLKKQKEAVELLAEGLRHIPGNAGLQRQYEKLGGPLPYPDPYPQAAPETAASAAPAVEPPSTAVAQAGEPGAVQSAPAQDTSANAPAQAQPPAIQPAVVQPAIGSPSNPWCRFCPDGPAAVEAPAQAGGRDQAR